uniref:A-type inclusion protein n=1 Tax=Rousettus bat poxvirus TaxID=3141933 RepID=A0AAU7E1Q3_9POXV
MVVVVQEEEYRGVIRRFSDIVDAAWAVPLDETTCLHRHERAWIKIVFRYLVDSAVFRNTDYDIFYPTVTTNRFMLVLLRDRDSHLTRTAGSFFTEDDLIAGAVDTKGKYMLAAVLLLLLCGGQETYHNGPSVLGTLREYIELMARIHAEFGCSRMFIGIPDYFMQYLSHADTLTLADKLRDTAGFPSMPVYAAFLDFMARLKANRTPVLGLSQRWMTLPIHESTPEFVLDALGYCSRDRVNVYNPYAGARMYVAKIGDDAYEYVALDTSYERGPIPGPTACTDVCAIAVLGIPEHVDAYRYKLFTPGKCDEQLVPHNFSRDVRVGATALPPNVEDVPPPNVIEDVPPLPLSPLVPPVPPAVIADEVPLLHAELADFTMHLNSVIADMRDSARCFVSVAAHMRRVEVTYALLRTQALELAQLVDERTLPWGIDCRGCCALL